MFRRCSSTSSHIISGYLFIYLVFWILEVVIVRDVQLDDKSFTV